MYYSVAVRRNKISGEEANVLYQSLIKFPKGNSAHYCGMRKHLQTTVYVLCNSAVVLNKSGKAGSAFEERWVSKANVM
jgi:hypothetical protein